MDFEDEYPFSRFVIHEPPPNSNGEPSRLNPYSLCQPLPGPSSQGGRRFGKYDPQSRRPSPQQQPYQLEYDEYIPNCMENVVPYRCPLHPDTRCAGYGPPNPNGPLPMPWVPAEHQNRRVEHQRRNVDRQRRYVEPEVLEVVTLDSDSSVSCSEVSSGDEEEPPVEPTTSKPEPNVPTVAASQNQPGCSKSKQEPVPPPTNPARRPIWPLPDGPIKLEPHLFALQPLIESKKKARRYARWQRSTRRAERRLKRQNARNAMLAAAILPDDTESEALSLEMLIAIRNARSTQSVSPNVAQSVASTSRQQAPKTSSSAQSAPPGTVAQAEASAGFVALRRSERLLGRDSAFGSDPQPSTSAEGMTELGGSLDD